MMNKVFFVGAGPGDPDLLTIKGKRIIDTSQVIIYAGSLVPRQVIESCRNDAEIYNSAKLDLNEVVDIITKAYDAGKQVARVHTGDPSIYGAIREQIDMLNEKNISWEIVPGVSSFTASAAALGKEFTLPGVSQSVICTRISGRTKVPKEESLELLASHRASMAIFLSFFMK